jgi:hypothetical protein
MSGGATSTGGASCSHRACDTAAQLQRPREQGQRAPCLRRTCGFAWDLSSHSFVAVRIKRPTGRGGMAVRPSCGRADDGAEGDGMALADMARHGGAMHGQHGDAEWQAGGFRHSAHGGGHDMAGLGGDLALPQAAPLQDVGLGGGPHGIGVAQLVMPQLAAGSGRERGHAWHQWGAARRVPGARRRVLVRRRCRPYKYAVFVCVVGCSHCESIWDDTRRITNAVASASDLSSRRAS